MQQHFCASLLFIFQVDWGSIEFWNPFNVKWQKKRLTSLLHLFAWLFTSKLKCKRSNTTVDPIQFSSHHSSKSRTIRFLFFSSFFFTRIFPLFSSRLASPTLIPPQSIRGHNWKGYFHAKLIPNEGVKCCWLVGWCATKLRMPVCAVVRQDPFLPLSKTILNTRRSCIKHICAMGNEVQKLSTHNQSWRGGGHSNSIGSSTTSTSTSNYRHRMKWKQKIYRRKNERKKFKVISHPTIFI